MTKFKITLLLLLISATTFSQSKLHEEAKNFFWGKNDKNGKIIDIPEYLTNESAVIIYKNVNYDFHKFGKKVTYKTSIRKRIKLLDQVSVNEFSEFSYQKNFYSSKGQLQFWNRKGEVIVGIKIIKPDGTETEIDVEKAAVTVDKESKVAIPDLEIGDIIDYFIYTVEPFKSTYEFGFDPVETTLSEEYPILSFKLFFETENDFFINFKSFNGAPELKQLQTDKKSIRRYSLEAQNIDKYIPIKWSFPLTYEPSYKFQVYFARSGKFENRALAFLPEKEKEIKSSVSKQEVLDLYDNRFKPDGKLGDVRKFFKKKTFKNDEEMVSDAYYFMRHYYLTRLVEAFIVREADILYDSFYYYKLKPVFIQNQKQFIKHFTAFLRKNKIKYEIVVAKKRYDGSIDDLLIEKNVEVLVKVLTKKPLYASFFSIHTNINQFSPLLEGTKVYLLSAERSKINQIKTGELPTKSYTDNETIKNISLKLNSDFSTIDVTSDNKIKGHSKIDILYDYLSFNDYVNEDYKKYQTKSLLDRIRNKKDRAQIKGEMKALADKLKTKKEKQLKESAAVELNIKEVEDFKFSITNNGRYGFDEYFEFSESFKIKNNFIKRAGPNYIIEIGKFIGGQISFEGDRRIRTKPVQMNYPRTFSYSIELDIPEGYSVTGLDKLSKSVDNSSGSFKSDAKIENNKLIINTTKAYKSNFVPNSKWQEMLDFLDAANQFTNEKIMLKKK